MEERPKALVVPTDVAGTADHLWEVFASTMAEGRPHTVARLGQLCRFGRDDETGALELRIHDVDTFRDQLTRHVQPVSRRAERERTCGVRAGTAGEWVGEGDDRRWVSHPGGVPHRHDDACYEEVEEYVPARVPDDVVQAILKRPLDRLDEVVPVPRVDRIVDVPVYAPGGALVTEPGHHAVGRVYYQPFGNPARPVGWADDADRPQVVQEAREFLLDDLLGDFPFADEASQAHALALVVEQFARGLVRGPTPMYAVIAAEQGTGKSLLVQACLAASCGLVDLSPEPDEHAADFQKRLLSELIRGPRAIVFDNVTRPLSSPALAAMLTTGRYADRVLGRSQILSFPVRHTTVATMNNPEIDADMRRRVVPIYLDAGVERPWERVGPPGRTAWRHANLIEWAAAHRAELASAALTLVANWVEGWRDVDWAGDEYTARAAPPRMMGSFEAWSRVVGGVVTAAGAPGFGGNLERLFAEQSDDDREVAGFLADWPEGARLTAAEVHQMVTVGLPGELFPDDPVYPPFALRDRRGNLSVQSVGNGLGRLKGRVRGGRRLESDASGRHTMWFVVGA